MKEPFWTVEMVNRLTALLADGVTYSEIGRQLGCGKNAAMGKATRLGLAEGAANAAGPRATLRTLHDRMDAEHARMDAVLDETAEARG